MPFCSAFLNVSIAKLAALVASSVDNIKDVNFSRCGDHSLVDKLSKEFEGDSLNYKFPWKFWKRRIYLYNVWNRNVENIRNIVAELIYKNKQYSYQTNVILQKDHELLVDGYDVRDENNMETLNVDNDNEQCSANSDIISSKESINKQLSSKDDYEASLEE